MLFIINSDKDILVIPRLKSFSNGKIKKKLNLKIL